MTCGVYILESPSGKSYIGSSVDIKVRLKRHRTDLRRGIHSNGRLQAAYSKHGPFNARVLVICRPEDRLLYEQIAIDALAPEYNLSRDATCFDWPQHMRERQSAKLKGRRRSPEAIAKTAAALRGKPKSPEHRAKLAAANRGKKASDETRRKMAEKERTPAMLEALRKGRELNTRKLSDEQKRLLSEKMKEAHASGAYRRDARGRLLPLE